MDEQDFVLSIAVAFRLHAMILERGKWERLARKELRMDHWENYRLARASAESIREECDALMEQLKTGKAAP